MAPRKIEESISVELEGGPIRDSPPSRGGLYTHSSIGVVLQQPCGNER